MYTTCLLKHIAHIAVRYDINSRLQRSLRNKSPPVIVINTVDYSARRPICQLNVLILTSRHRNPRGRLRCLGDSCSRNCLYRFSTVHAEQQRHGACLTCSTSEFSTCQTTCHIWSFLRESKAPIDVKKTCWEPLRASQMSALRLIP